MIGAAMDAIGLLRIHSPAEELTDTAGLFMQGCHPSILTSEPMNAARPKRHMGVLERAGVPLRPSDWED